MKFEFEITFTVEDLTEALTELAATNGITIPDGAKMYLNTGDATSIVFKNGDPSEEDIPLE